ncbi:MAG: deoxyribose-phosphate aldolase [Chitinophagales bacterium]|nr:deoxyribose-phosphate aldolase [Chitinophagales bacterium]
MNWIIENFPLPVSFGDLGHELKIIKKRSMAHVDDATVLEQIFNCIDLTSLNSTDSSFSISDFVEKVNLFEKSYPDLKNVAAICVYPVFAPVMKSVLRAKHVQRAVVSGGFPSSQTFSDLKREETKKALAFGADEVDIVISIGEFLEGNFEFVSEEIIGIKEVMGSAHLKVIIESGALRDAEDIWIASLLSMKCGADFIKTSTGKMPVGATPEAAYIMCTAIKHFYEKTGKKIGFKPAGGVSTIEEALVYYQIVNDVLGTEWLNNHLFRVGASRLANALLSKILELKGMQAEKTNFF